jgi:hypothetical protein
VYPAVPEIEIERYTEYRDRSGSERSITPSSPSDTFSDASTTPPTRTMDAERLRSLEQDAVAQREQSRVIAETLQVLLSKINNLETQRTSPTPEVAGHKTARSATPPDNHKSRHRVRPCAPAEFDGDRAKGRTWLTTVLLYLTLAQTEFEDDTQRIHWALSFFRSGRAATFAQRMVREETDSGVPSYDDWATFQHAFIADFCPENEATTAIMRLESSAYYQGKRPVDIYVDEFRDLISISRYTDPITVVLKFRRGLHPTTQDKIAESGSDRPSDSNVEGWYKAARRFDQNRLANEAFHMSGWRRTPTTTTISNQVAPTCSAFTLSRNGPATNPPMPLSSWTPPPPRSTQQSMGTPMDIDAQRARSTPRLCHRCKATDHVIRDCPQRFDVRHMNVEEEDDLFMRLCANRDAREAAAQNDDKDHPYVTDIDGNVTTATELLDRDVKESDFLRSSG